MSNVVAERRAGGNRNHARIPTGGFLPTVVFGVVASLAISSGPARAAAFTDATDRLPITRLAERSMSAAAADLDEDGDLDIIVAIEFGANLVLYNDGTGQFPDDAVEILPGVHDSEDIAIADFNGDGLLDIAFVSEDDAAHELYFNVGGSFRDESHRIPIQSVTNGVAVLDINQDGHPDLVLASNGPDAVLINDGEGGFRDESVMRLPPDDDVSQDVTAGDVNGDGHLDLVFANEGQSRVLINDGNGIFSDEGGLPAGAFESREAVLGDVDGDGDLDLFLANVAAFMRSADPQNRLFLNDGTGTFTDVTDGRLPADRDMSFVAALHDVDADGDLDILTGNTNSLSAPGTVPVRVYLNDGAGAFAEGEDILPPSARGNAFAIEAADFDGDGRADFYLALRYGQDRLLLADPG